MSAWRTGGVAVMILALTTAATAAPGQEASWPDLSQPPRATGGGEHDAAVIIGAENYTYVERVPGARQNASDWQAYLTETLKVPVDRVALLLDDDATNDAIRQAAVEKAAQVEPGGTLWFVFIGHGAPSKDGKDGLLVGVDAQQKLASIYSRSISRDEILGLLAKGRQAKTAVLLDACFSGRSPSGQALVAGLQPLVVLRALPLGVDRRAIVMTAARSDQFAGPLPGGGRPAFSYLALGALRGWAADARGNVTASGLVEYVRRVLSLARDRTQTPELSTPETAKAVLGTGREAGPNLARLQREAAMSSGADFKWKEPAAGGSSINAVRQISGATRPIPGRTGIQWVRIPGGKFTMGSGRGGEAPEHDVTIKPFQMAKTLVTNRQYAACVAAGACTAAHVSDGTCLVKYGSDRNPGKLPDSFRGDDQPIVCVDWSQAKAFSAWVGGRLPSEAEWEYAARSAGGDQQYPWGRDPATCERAVIAGCASATAPVCSRPAGNTQQGLCDMAGETWEWVQDWYHNSYDGAPTDGSAWDDAGTSRVVRGGSWSDDAGVARSTTHLLDGPSQGYDYLSFRPVR